MLALTRRCTDRIRGAARIGIGAFFLAAALDGCGADFGGFEPTYPPHLQFWGWDSLSTDGCRGWVYNLGHAAGNARVRLWYATVSGEISHVVNIGAVEDFGGASFLALPQLTQGEPRFPRVGQIMWDARDGGLGASPEEPRMPALQFYSWCWTASDSLQGRVINFGGYAYHVALTLESRDGVLDYAPQPRGHVRTAGEWYIRSAARESTGISLLPTILKIRWEDYGGIRDSVLSPTVDTAAGRCY